MNVSIILLTRNEKTVIEPCLNSLFSQTYKNIEIVVVDSSTDETPQIISELVEKSPFPVRIISQEPMGVAAARNRGIDVSRGEIIGLMDADLLLAQNCVEEVTKTFMKNEDIFGVEAPPTPLAPQTTFGRMQSVYYGTKRNIQRDLVLRKTMFDYAETGFYTLPRFLRKSLFKIVGKFDETKRYEDFDFLQRVDKKLGLSNAFVFCKSTCIYNNWEDKDDLVGHFKKCKWYGSGWPRMLKEYPRIFIPQLLSSLYLAAIPVFLILLVLNQWVALLLIPFLLFWVYLMYKASKSTGFSLLAVLLPFLAIYKAYGHLFGFLEFFIKHLPHAG